MIQIVDPLVLECAINDGINEFVREVLIKHELLSGPAIELLDSDDMLGLQASIVRGVAERWAKSNWTKTLPDD